MSYNLEHVLKIEDERIDSMSDKSWRVDSYQEGAYKISVRKNLENDRVDEGDLPDNERLERINLNNKE